MNYISWVLYELLARVPGIFQRDNPSLFKVLLLCEIGVRGTGYCKVIVGYIVSIRYFLPLSLLTLSNVYRQKEEIKEHIQIYEI